MIKNATLLVSTLLLGAGAAQAADVVDMPVSDWSGFYAGIHGGYGTGSFDDPATFSAPCPTRNTCRPVGPPIEFDFDSDISASGAFGGVQGGWNWQSDSLVLGVEGDVSLSNINGDSDFSLTDQDFGFSGETTVDWFGTARLRGGFLATPELLLYATGGLAWGAVTFDYDIVTSRRFPDQSSGSNTESQMGWTVGGGLEYMVSESISVKAEYLYVDLGEADLGDDTLDCGVAGDCNLSLDPDVSFHTIRAGLNWHF